MRKFAKNIHRKLFSISLIIVLSLLSFSQKTIATTNLLSNANFENVSTQDTTRPEGWIKGRWGVNSSSFVYPDTGVNNSQSVSITISSLSSGDAKWTTENPIPVQGGVTYQYTDFYISDVVTFVTLEITLSNGNIIYADILQPGPAAQWTQLHATFTMPQGAQYVRVFHLINKVGTLKIDNTSFSANSPTDNLVQNPSLESVTQNMPDHWSKGKWGVNTTSFIFPMAAYDGTNAARVDMSSWQSGDAKWYFEEVPVTSGSPYEFSDYSKSTTQSYITVRFLMSDGTFSYMDLGNMAANAAWTQFKSSFTVPSGVVSLTIFHLIKSIGTLDIDQYSLKKLLSDPTKFDKGYVSINFDDGWLSSYQNALPIINQAGFKTDQFIITSRMTDNSTGYIKTNQVLNLQAQGQVVGAHTRTHVDLTTIPIDQAQTEITGSRSDLLNAGLTPVDVFAYPLGGYNDAIKQLVKNTGFIAARSSDGGYNDKQTDKYALRRQPMVQSTTIDQVKSYIDTAVTEKRWVILLFHDVSNAGTQYSVTPAVFQEIIDYLKQKNITPITIKQGVTLMGQ